MKNKEIYLVCTYTPDNERIDMLNNIVNFLRSTGKDILLVTHSPNTPSNIISKCKYFLYSSENILLDEPEHKYFGYYYVGGREYGSKYFNPYKPTTIAIYDMILNGLSLLKNIGYDIAHYVEYDCNFENDNTFKLFSEKISEGYDCCVFTGDVYDYHGGTMSFNINSFSNDELKIDVEKFLEWSKEIQVTEYITKNYFLKGKKVFEYSLEEARNNGYNMTNYAHSRKGLKMDSIFIENGKVFYFCNNNSGHDRTLSILINGSFVTEINVPTGTYLYKEIFQKELVKSILFIKENKIIEEFDFSTEEKINKFIRNTYINTIEK